MALAYFHHQITLKAVCGFLDRFSNLIVQKYDEVGDVRRTIRVPIQYGNRDKFLQVIEAEHSRTDLNNRLPAVEMDQFLPRMGVMMLSIVPDPQRHTTRRQKISAVVSESEKQVINNPAPWNVEVEMTIMTKTMDDAFQIMEQILPLFAPSISMDIETVQGMPSESVKIVLQSVTPNNDGDMDPSETRIQTWNLVFTMTLNYHLPKVPNKIITEITDNFYHLETLEKFKTYEMTAINTVPVTSPADRADEPVTTVITDWETYEEPPVP